MRRVVLAALLFVSGAAGAQSAQDSARLRAVKVQTDSIRKETCRNGVLSSSGLTCTSTGTNPAPRVTVLRRLANRVDSIERASLSVPPPPLNQKPVARFAATCVAGTPNQWTFNGSSSTDDKGIARWDWTASDPRWGPKTGVIINRPQGAVDPDYTETLTVTDSAGLTGTTSLLIAKANCAAGPPPTDTTTPPTTPPSPGVVELPRSEPRWRDPTLGAPCTINVAPSGLGANVDAALAQAAAGSGVRVVCLPAGPVQTFTVPARVAGDTGWIAVRAATMLWGEGIRAVRSQLASMPVIYLTTAGQMAIRTTPGTHHWYLAGIGIHARAQTYGMVQLGDPDPPMQDTFTEVPQHIVLSRMVMIADSVQVRRCVSLQSGQTAIVDSWIDDCHDVGADSQAIWGNNGPGPYLIQNNHLAGAGENIMFGGSGIAFAVIPADITIRRNHIFTPQSWRGVWLKKNLFEIKTGTRILIEANVFDGTWVHGQTGVAVSWGSTNNNGGTSVCRYCKVTDVTFRRNLIRNADGGVGTAPLIAGPVDTTTRRVYIGENVLDNLAVGADPNRATRKAFLVMTNTFDVTVERNVASGPYGVALQLEEPGTQRAVFRDNVWAYGNYGVHPSVALGAPGAVWSNQTFVGAAVSGYPPGTLWVSSESQAPLAAQIRAIVQQATAGVVVPP